MSNKCLCTRNKTHVILFLKKTKFMSKFQYSRKLIPQNRQKFNEIVNTMFFLLPDNLLLNNDMQ